MLTEEKSTRDNGWHLVHLSSEAASTSILRKRCSENMHFIEIALWHGCSPINLLHIFRTPFPKNTWGRLLLYLIKIYTQISCQGIIPLEQLGLK